VFGLVFVGFNVAFLPMHLTGLLGMPRRVHTYPAGLGWEPLNLLSTIGAFMIAAGVLLLLIDLVRTFRIAGEQNAGNVWRAGTLEWLPSGNYSSRSIPIVRTREPLWDQPNLAADVEAGRYYLPGSATGGRETIVTSALHAAPQYLLLMPRPGWAPVLGAAFTAAFFLLLTVKAVALALVCGLLAVVLVLRWLWVLDGGSALPNVDIGGGIRLPTYVTGATSHSWWGTVVLILVAGALFASAAFSYLYLWTVSPEAWPGREALPPGRYPLAAGIVLAAAGAAVAWSSRALTRGATRQMRVGLAVAVPLAIAATVLELAGQSATGLRATDSAYGAAVYLLAALQGAFAALVVLMALFTLARSAAGRLDRVHRVTFDNTMLLWHYTVAQGLAGLALVHGFPRLVG
jgi:cytochrome c oxidase subunit I+III